jgi:hypothetical protein
VKSCWLNPHETKKVSISFVPSITRFGNDPDPRRLNTSTLIVIRIFSFSPLDLPNTINTFKLNDKHIAFRAM